ncbi:MAG: cytochrome c3 family protein [Deltaproteobacteria bacterium]|nr:cytochrome c3 family protein [Deltaproteobacteria bacterium]
METKALRKVLSLSITALLVATCFWLYGRRDNASATSGAFPYVKHGGGTTDGVTPYDAGNGPGVDRSVNQSDYGSYYNNLNTEAGKYKGGECTQCHEPHASFGGSEPKPVNGAADPYLLMRYGASVTNYAELCWYCHESMTLNGSGSTGQGYWRFYQGKTVFLPGQDRFPGIEPL